MKKEHNKEEKQLAKIVGKLIRNEREDRNIKLKKITYETGISQSNLSLIERGLVNTKLISLYKILRALNIKPNIRKLFK